MRLLKFGCILMMMLLVSFSASANRKVSFVGHFDNDNRQDSVWIERSEENSNSAFYHVVCAFSTLSKRVSFDCEYYFSDFFMSCPIPAVVVQHKKFADKLSGELVQNVSCNIDSGALQWVSQVCQNGDFTNDSIVDFKSKFSVHWEGVLPNIKRASYALVDSELFKCSSRDGTLGRGLVSKYGILFYMANNHKQINKTIDIHGGQILVTNHGLILKRADKYAWLFINENSIFKNGSEKFRWPSIKDIQVFDQFLVVETISKPTMVASKFVICLKSQMIYRLKDPSDSDSFLNLMQSLCK